MNEELYKEQTASKEVMESTKVEEKQKQEINEPIETDDSTQ
jgi:hypothetical protein